MIFLVLIVGPAIAGPKFIDVQKTFKSMPDSVQVLIQPSNWNNNDTTASKTGVKAGGAAGASGTAGAGGNAGPTSKTTKAARAIITESSFMVAY